MQNESGYIAKTPNPLVVAACEFVCRACRLVANRWHGTDGKRCKDCIESGRVAVDG